MTQGLLTLLRSRTREAHGALEHSAPMGALLGSGVGVEEYRRALLRLLAFHRWIAARLVESAADPETAGTVPAAFLLDGRVDDLRADLAWLGAEVPDEATDAPAPPGTAPPAARAGLPEALGILYVSEGSRLGGAVLGRHLAAALGLDRERGLRFFLGAPPDGPSGRWRELCALLESHAGRGPEFTERVAASAEACFGVARRLLAAEGA